MATFPAPGAANREITITPLPGNPSWVEPTNPAPVVTPLRSAPETSPSTITPSEVPPEESTSVRLGIDVLREDGFAAVRGKKIGLLTNPSGVDSRRRSTIEVLRNAADTKLIALFAPEHGINGDVLAGNTVPETIHKNTGLPVYSLYGKTRKPTKLMLKDIDSLVYDLQDIGCRSYTFISTMGLAMEACAAAGVEFVVLDRPNPLGGERVEGPLWNARFRSFIGQWDIPYIYGMTCGELARMINGERWINKPCQLKVIPIQGWRRSMVWRDTGLAWIPPSPRIVSAETALFYASTGMLGEVGGVSIGMNLGRPFECIAAPWLRADRLSRQMNSYGLRGVEFLPFTTNANHYLYQGVRIHFTDPARSTLSAINFYALDAIQEVSGRNLFMEAHKADKNFTMFDKANGTDATRWDLIADRPPSGIAQSWSAGEERFRTMRRKYLIYPD
jgi:uncharacterized protein YbbC (DUF1343 family)